MLQILSSPPFGAKYTDDYETAYAKPIVERRKKALQNELLFKSMNKDFYLPQKEYLERDNKKRLCSAQDNNSRG